MTETTLSTVLVVIVLILLALDIIIAILILKIVLSLRRFTKLIDAVVDDIEKFQSIMQKITFPRSLAQVIRSIASWLPDSKSKNDSDK